MKSLLHSIPWCLHYSRLLVSVLLLMFAFTDLPPAVIIAFCGYAILCDILCGIVTWPENRKHKALLQLDTKIDTIFWFCCLFYLCVHRPDFLGKHIAGVFILVCSELFIILLGLLRFRERISFHTILSRLWLLLLFWCFTELVSGRPAGLSFSLVFWFGLAAQLEIVAIACIIRKNTIPVPGIIRAIRYRKGLL